MTATEILNQAKNLVSQKSQPIDFRTYEYFKGLLQAEGHFGYERELAEILGL